MNDSNRNIRSILNPGFIGLLAMLSVAFSIMSCVAIPVAAVIYYQSTKHFTATVEMDANADEVFNVAVAVAKNNPQLNITKQDNPSFLLEAEEKETGRFASLKVVSLGKEKSQLIVTADAGLKKKEDKALALQVVTRVCEVLGVPYSLVKNEK